MPLQATSGAASYDAFGGGVPSEPNYIESCFSTWLYTGNGSTQTITNGIDLSTKGGLVWNKKRSTTQNHYLTSTAQGTAKQGSTNNTNAFSSNADVVTAFLTTGFSVGSTEVNDNAATYASWTFRKQPKFFDVVTYTGNITARTIAHSLGSAPGMIVVKQTSGAGGTWWVYHRSLGATQYLSLDETSAAGSAGNLWDSTEPTSTVFSIGANANSNANGQTFVAYLFAHDAGGFGLTGTDNVISCGSYTGNGTSENNITLGYEPQWVLIKDTTSAYKWLLMDNMRGLSMGTSSAVLSPNSSDAETANGAIQPTATGFTLTSGGGFLNGSGDNYIYIAIRRGPMKVPTSGTSVYNAIARNGTGALVNVTGVGFAPDLVTVKNRNAGYDPVWVDKLRGNLPILASSSTAAEVTDNTDSVKSFNMDGITLGGDNPGTYGGAFNFSTSNSYINWFFKRAPSFFDEVCYTGTGASSQVLTHNLTVTPQLTIFKKRSASNPWDVVSGNTSYLQLNENFAASPDTSIAATATTITAPLGAGNGLNASGATYVAYLFATCAGVSKCGTFTGNGSSQTINCGFTGGARFVMIKATSTTGDWLVADSARGIVSGNDPYLELNTTNAEVTGEDWLDTDSTGFVVNEVSGSNANTNGVTYIFLAIA